jgi:tRNA threonylcarbamoyladenosine biosynthesis protein TsaB
VSGSARQPFVLALDTAGSACSVTVAVGDRVLCSERIMALHGQSEALLPMVDAAMRKAGLLAAELDRIATTVGPGSFTGIRVGLAAARGIALASGARLTGVTSFEAVLAGLPALDGDGKTCLVLIALESRREDLYIQLFDRAHGPLTDPVTVLPDALGKLVAEFVAEAPLLVTGDAAERAGSALLPRPGALIVKNSAPCAEGVLKAALRQWQRGGANSEPRPLYLRPPDVTISDPHRSRLPSP